MIHLKLILQRILPTALVLAATACGGGGGGGGGAISIEDLEEEVAQALCADAAECGLSPTVQACLDSFGPEQGQILADVAAGLVEYDGSKARECLESSGISICNLFSNTAETLAACDETFTGSVPLGGSCFSDEICAGDSECDGAEADSCSAGTCVAGQANDALGQSCTNTSCASGLRCSEQEVCEALGGAGDTCNGFGECAAGLVCERGGDQTPGTCIALVATGGSCNPEIGGFFFSACLNKNDYCDASDSTCKNRLAPGASCAGETLGDACVRYASCQSGSCVANLLVGESCVIDGGGPECLFGLDCEGGVCAADDPDPICTL